MSGKVKVWGNLVTVEWADPIEDPDPEVMAKVRHRTKSPQQCNLECICTHNLFRLVHLFGFALHFCMRNKQNMLLYPGQGAVCEKLGEHCYRGDT